MSSVGSRLFLILAAIVAVCGCSSRPPWADGRMVREEWSRQEPSPSYDKLPQRLLAIHNRERAQLDIPPLTWDPALARAAASYGRALVQSGRFVHSVAHTRPGQGENLWMGTHGAYSIERMAGGWAAEERIFRPGTFPEVSTSGKWADVAHYTQMIWRSTKRVGCALEQGRDWDYLVCRYAPAGNVIGQRVP